MKNRIILSIAVAALLVPGGLWLLTRTAPRHPQSIPASAEFDQPAATDDAPATAPVNVAPPAPLPVAAGPSRPPAPGAVDLSVPIDPAHATEVRVALDELKAIYGQAGPLDWNQAKALIARREQATRELVGRLAALGPGGARALAAGYTADADSARAKLLLVQALGRINDGEAASVLETLLGRNDSLSLRKEIILAMGKRGDSASEQSLAGVMADEGDPQLRFAAAQALSGREDALPWLADRLRSETSSDVRRELVRSVGMIGNTAARTALTQIAETPGDLALRQTAIQELGRSFGVAALSNLETLLKDATPAIRTSSVKSLARVKTDSAKALLQQAADNDPSALVRDAAIAAVRQQ